MAKEHVDLGLIDEDHDANETILCEVLGRLVNGEQDSKAAAAAITDMMIKDCEDTMAQYLNLASNSAHSNDGKDMEPSSAIGWQHMLWRYLGRSAMMIPPDHPGQQHLVAFVVDLQRLPRRTVKAFDHGLQTCDEVF